MAREGSPFNSNIRMRCKGPKAQSPSRMFSRQCNRPVRGLASRLLEIEQHRQVIARDKTHDRRHRRGALSPERPKNRYGADCELRQAAFRGDVREPFADIGADSRT
jgi:hypothetical protein